jgi:hypothetical protein
MGSAFPSACELDPAVFVQKCRFFKKKKSRQFTFFFFFFFKKKNVNFLEEKPQHTQIFY